MTHEEAAARRHALRKQQQREMIATLEEELENMDARLDPDAVRVEDDDFRYQENTLEELMHGLVEYFGETLA